MKLIPRQPPRQRSGHVRMFVGEIQRLRAMDYTLEAIREALADVGVVVSLSTLRRVAPRQLTPSAGVDTPRNQGGFDGQDVGDAEPGVTRPLHLNKELRMKVAVISFSGNVGKTTVARHLLAPRIPGSDVVTVESINADGRESMVVKGSDYAELQEFLVGVDSAVVDVGASNVEEFIEQMKRYRNSQEDFDCFIVPTVPSPKQQTDTASTLLELARAGVPPERMRVVFNQVDSEPVEKTFEVLLEFCSASGVVQPRPSAVIPMNEVYALVRANPMSLTELAADRTDFKAAIAQARTQSDKLALAQELALRRLACGVVPELDACFAALDLGGTSDQAVDQPLAA